MNVLHGVITSPWIYLLIFGIAAVDGFFPVVPSESLVITAGVYAAGGEPHLGGVIVVAAAGALTGDHISYLIGRTSSGRLDRWLRPGGRRHTAFRWAGRVLGERGGLILVVARYIPGGRTAATMTMGAVRHPLRSFVPYAVLAAASWGVYSAAIGYLGGRAFEDDPLRGLAAGIGLAITITVTVEGVRCLRRGRGGQAGTAPDAGTGRDRENVNRL